MRYLLLLILLLMGVLPLAHATQTHKVAIRTISGTEAGLLQWGPTLEYLNISIPGHRFEFIPYPVIKNQLDDAKVGKFQFLLTNPATYVEIRHSAGARALLTLINKRHNTAQTRFGSVIFIRADRDDIYNIKDLAGKHLKAVSELAFGGWRVAWLEMLQNNFDPYEQLGQLSFADGNQPAVVSAVQNGEVDAGVVRTDMLERLHNNGVINLAGFRILHNRETEGFPFFHSTPLYPEWPFAVMPGVDEALAEQVKQALLKLDAKQPAAIKGQYIGWIEALDYQQVDKLLQDLHIGPYKKKQTGGINFHYLYPVGIILILLTITVALRKPSVKNPNKSNQA